MSDRRKTIVLTMPPASLEERYGRIASVGNTMPSLGLAYLASYLRKHGYDPIILEPAAFNLSYKDVIDRIRSVRPSYVGISFSTGMVFNAARLAEEIKTHDPGVTVIVGGPHVTAVPLETMSRIGHFDIGVIGEGELVLKELLDTLKTGGDIRAVKGIVFRDNDGTVTETERRPYVEDLDTLPQPAWDLIPGFPASYTLAAPMSIRKPAGNIITSRGCPYECIFCDRSVFGRHYRLHSADYVLESFRILREQYRVRNIMVYDDTFMAAKKRLHEICHRLIQEKNRVVWSCTGNIHVDYETLRLMKQAGCWQIGYGIESGSEKVLASLKKKQSLAQIADAITLSKKAGIRTRGFFIIGSPRETRDDIRRSVELAKRLPLDDFQMTNFTPFPGSEAYGMCEQYGTFDKRWEKMNVLEPIFVPSALASKEELTALQDRAHKEFYFRPGIVWSYLSFAVRYPRVLVNMYKGMVVLVRMMFEGSKRLHK
ncbi:MAG: cobalamin-dependent protein [Candidatus Omnitrophica bacterium]|nr:cobalamin-dependent protein [Candidatus Omnitrophota bacterium]